MSRFIKTGAGWINQDHILLIRFGMTKEETGKDLIEMSDGRIVQTQIEDFEWLGPKYAVEEENRRAPEDRSMAWGSATEAPDAETPPPQGGGGVVEVPDEA